MSENLVPIFAKIDCVKIEKQRLFAGKKGAKYLDAILVPTPNSEYGDFMIVQSVSKEEREAGVKGPILGNAKLSQKQQAGGSYRPAGALPKKAGPGQDDDSDSVPF